MLRDHQKGQSHAGDNRTANSIFHVTNFFLFDQTHKQVNIIYPCPYTASLDDVKTSQTSFKFSRTIIMIIYPLEWDNRRMGHSEPSSVHWIYVSGPGTTDTGEGSGNILQLISDYETLPLSLPVLEYPPSPPSWLCHEEKCGLCSLGPMG